MVLENSIISHIENTTANIAETYTCCDDFITIGGLALYCHMQSVGLSPLINTTDADVMCGHISYSYIRDEFDLAYNSRMDKHEYKVSLSINGQDKGIDVDVYVVYQNALDVKVEEIINYSEIHKGIKCAHLVHLLVLKIDNYLKFDGDKTSHKFQKVVHDIFQIVGMLTMDTISKELIRSNFSLARLNALKNITKSHKEVYTAVCLLFKVSCFSHCLSNIENYA